MKNLINIKLEPNTWIQELDEGTQTHYAARSVVTILDITKKFEHDEFLHKARDWINKTFAEEEFSSIINHIKLKTQQIEALKKENNELEKKLKTFLVPVRIEKV